MINLTANITFPNVNRWQVLAFDIANGRVTLRFWAPAATLPTPTWIDVQCILSDEAGKSGVAGLNPAPTSWNDKIIVTLPGPGILTGSLVNALTNAQNAYRGAGNHNAGLRAVEGKAMDDNWVAETLNGT